MGENRSLEKRGSAPDTALKNGLFTGFKNLFNNRLKTSSAGGNIHVEN
jgi:hypothetical protein